MQHVQVKLVNAGLIGLLRRSLSEDSGERTALTESQSEQVKQEQVAHL